MTQSMRKHRQLHKDAPSFLPAPMYLGVKECSLKKKVLGSSFFNDVGVSKHVVAFQTRKGICFLRFKDMLDLM